MAQRSFSVPHAAGLSIVYQTKGDPTHPPILLVQGLGAHILHWPYRFIDGLVSLGYFVIYFDNRDAGKSSRLSNLPCDLKVVTIGKTLTASTVKALLPLAVAASSTKLLLSLLGWLWISGRRSGFPTNTARWTGTSRIRRWFLVLSVLVVCMRQKKQLLRPLLVRRAYTLKDMAQDAVSVLDHLNIDKAHVLGISMGGMIAQTIAIHFPERVLTLTSTHSNTGRRDLKFQPNPLTLLPFLLRKKSAPTDEAGCLRDTARSLNFIRYPHSPIDGGLTVEEAARRINGHSKDTSGLRRQLAALLTEDPRDELLRKVNVPALVIHGKADPLVPVSNAKHTADCLSRRGADTRLVLIERMAHDLNDWAVDEMLIALRPHLLKGSRTTACST